MPKYSYSKEVENQTKVEETPTPATIKYVKIESLIQSRMEYTGKVSGRLYIWNGGGDTVSVLEEDAQDLLSKHYGKSCCGNSEVYLFQRAL